MYLCIIRQNRSLISCVLFLSFVMEPFQSFGVLNSLWACDQKRILMSCNLCSNNLIHFSLRVSLTKSTLGDFGRWSNTISATPWKLSDIGERKSKNKAWPSITYATGSFVGVVIGSTQASRWCKNLLSPFS